VKNINNPIIPIKPTFVNSHKVASVNYEAICLFAATGFFWENDTYWKNQKVLAPATHNEIDGNNKLVSTYKYFDWHYQPKQKYSFNEALEEFTHVFEMIVDEQIGNQQAILPISGGLDSRSQAVALKHMEKKVTSYSYSFSGGYSESGIAKKIAKVCDFKFQEFFIPKGYLWNVIEDLAEINRCYSEFTHPRQMAVLPEFNKLDGIFSLGHWGDVLFDKGAAENFTEKNLIQLVKKKVLKKGGLEFGKSLWESWGLDSNFEEYLERRIKSLLAEIKISHVGAKMRAFKSLYWAPRWTSVNLSVFERANPISLPYYDNRMCEFVCKVPEEYLADRKLQIAYIQKRNPQVAKITWEDQRPFNLNNYQYNKMPYNLPFKVGRKLKAGVNKIQQKKYIQRNWELQFLGEENDKQLQAYLFQNGLKDFIPETVIQQFYKNFKEKDSVTYSHPVSMLLTLSVWNKKFNDAK